MRCLTLVSFLTIVVETATFANPFTNGSFEDPIIQGGPDFATVPTGWVKFDPSGIGLFMQLDSSFGIPFVPANGHQSFGFGANGTTTGSLSQTFDTIAGERYLVTFQYLIQQGPEREALRLQFFNGPTSLGSLAISGFTNNTWSTASHSFTAQSATTTLTFSDQTGNLLPPVGGNTNWALDAVTVTQIPEPSNAVLLGLFGLACWTFRRALRDKPEAKS
ncbi:MAG: DUF642 domain-containing protein [Acidobacteria bacterium]|nr:DUF642 domain-containing protein [Acidobacteriota bacterium]